MNKSQSGFTLIELVVVIVLLGILGVTALGKFQDLSGEASTAAVSGVASELAAASSVNYAKSLIGDGTTHVLGIGDGATGGQNQVDTTTAANACLQADLDDLLTSGLPSGYTIGVSGTTPANACAANAGATYTCTVTGKNSATADFTVVCTE